jgi:hypothetical protein
VPEPLGEQGQRHAGLVEVHRPRVPKHVRVDRAGTSGHLALAVAACWRMSLATLSADIRVGR